MSEKVIANVKFELSIGVSDFRTLLSQTSEEELIQRIHSFGLAIEYFKKFLSQDFILLETGTFFLGLPVTGLEVRTFVIDLIEQGNVAFLKDLDFIFFVRDKFPGQPCVLASLQERCRAWSVHCHRKDCQNVVDDICLTPDGKEFFFKDYAAGSRRLKEIGARQLP